MSLKILFSHVSFLQNLFKKQKLNRRFTMKGLELHTIKGKEDAEKISLILNTFRVNPRTERRILG